MKIKKGCDALCTNSKKFQICYQITFEKSCGCARRHVEWNQQYQYGI